MITYYAEEIKMPKIKKMVEKSTIFSGYLPVEPNPPAPLTVSLNSSFSTNSA